MGTSGGGTDSQELEVSDGGGPARGELSRRQLLTTVGAVGGLGALLPSLVAGLPAAQAQTVDSPTSAGGISYELYRGAFVPGDAPLAVFSSLTPASHSLDVVLALRGSGPTDAQTTTTRGSLQGAINLERPLGDSTMSDLLAQIRAGNFQKVVTNMDLVTRDGNGNTLNQLRLFNAWVSAIDVHGDSTNGWFEDVSITCDDFRLVKSVS